MYFSIIGRIKRRITRYKMRQWVKDMGAPSKNHVKNYENGSDRIYTQRLSDGLRTAVIKRDYQYNSVCVDLYWYIKPSKKEHHVYTVSKRCSWDKVSRAIKYVERHELPRAMYYAFSDTKRRSHKSL